MKPIFEIVMRSRELTGTENPVGVTRLTVRVEGMERNQAILFAETTYPGFAVYYVTNGPRNEVRD